LSDEAKELAELKRYLEEKLSSLQREVENLKAIIKLVDEALSKTSFKPALELMELPPSTEENVMLITTRDGKVLGKVYVGEDYMRVEPSPDLDLDINISPFKPFLIDKVLESMKAKDREAAERGLIDPDKVMDYRVHTEGDKLKYILVKNVVDERRVREIRSAVRWTFERMLERMRR